MPTEKGYFARLKEERIQRSVNASGFFTHENRVSAADKAYADAKYLKVERNSRKGESHLPETRKMTGEQIRNRLHPLFGERYQLARNILPGVDVTVEQIDPLKQRVTKKSINGDDIPPDKIRAKNNKPAYDTTKGDWRDDRKRANTADTVAKAKNTLDPAVMRGAWKLMDERTKRFLREKTK